MLIYHGGAVKIERPEIRVGVYNKDFGQGFYCTNFQRQAERWARRFDTPIVNVYEYSSNEGLDVLNYNVMTDEWLDFISSCRNGVAHKHDIVIGAMANDQVWNYVADFISGILTREQFWVLAKFKHPTHQIAFCTKEAIKCIRYVESYEVK